MNASNKNRADFVKLWGKSASLALLDAQCTLFQIPEVSGVIGYRFQGTAAIVFGDPVCAQKDIPTLVEAFHTFCKTHKKTIVYVASSPDFVQWSMRQTCQSAIQIGDELILDPCHNPKEGAGEKSSLLRRKHKRAMRDGIIVQEYCGNDPVVEKKMEAVAQQWLASRKGPQIYLFDIDLFSNRDHKRWFYAEYRDSMIGVLLLNRIDSQNGWALNILMLVPDAPNNPSEFIIMSVLDILRTEGCRYFSIGTIPRNELGQIIGMGAVSSWFLKKAYGFAKRFFNLGDRQRYWKKFQPRKVPSFLVMSKTRIGLRDIQSIIKALHGTR